MGGVGQFHDPGVGDQPVIGRPEVRFPVRGKFICSRRCLPVVVHVEAPAARAARPTHLFNLLLPCGHTATVALGPER